MRLVTNTWHTWQRRNGLFQASGDRKLPATPISRRATGRGACARFVLGPALFLVLVAFLSSGCVMALFCIACEGSLYVEGRVVGIQSAGGSDLFFGPHADAWVPPAAVGLAECVVALEPRSRTKQPTRDEHARYTW